MRKSHYISLLLVLVLVVPVVLKGTAQAGDNLIFKGKKYSLFTNPLEGYLEKNPSRLPKADAISTGNWRGYIATWEIKSDQLVLVDIEVLRAVKDSSGNHTTEYRSVMTEMFPDQKELAATWYTGHLVVPEGKLVEYVHMGYGSTYSRYILISVKAGKVVRTSYRTAEQYAGFRDEQFAEFKKTEEYRNALAVLDKEDSTLNKKQKEAFLRQFYSEKYMSMVFDKSN